MDGADHRTLTTGTVDGDGAAGGRGELETAGRAAWPE
jgi:hypothetical protein